MPKSTLNWKVCGAAGEGVKSTGLMFSKSCLRHGLFTFDYTDYPSLIRGGHNTYQVKAATTKVFSQEKLLDVLVALNENAFKLNLDEVTKDSIIIADVKNQNIDLKQYQVPCSVLDIPLADLAKSSGGEALMANNVALGASMFILGLDLTVLDSVIQDTFASKGKEIINQNIAAAKAGFDFANKQTKPLQSVSIQKQTPVDTHAMTGNEAVSLGLIAGGLKAYIAYPMTPSSSILHTLAAWAEPAKIMVKHAEDEIGVINMALGSSFAGVRVAVGTSGGGFAYMTEALGLSGVAELPLVLVESQRPGPALGMPTWTAQADLLFAINASQDEFPRIVLAPGDVKECFELAKSSLELAEKYQVPVILLIDKHISEGGQSIHFETTQFSQSQESITQNPKVNETGFFPRYTVTESGISPRTIPGQKDGYYIANSYEHDEQGIGIEEAKPRIDQMDKRFRKFDAIKNSLPSQFYDGGDNPAVTFISWGSTKLAVQRGVELLREEDIDAAMLNLTHMWPFPSNQVIEAIQKSQNPIVIEGNKTQQLARLIRSETGIDIYHKRSRYDGRPFYPYQIVQFAKEILQ